MKKLFYAAMVILMGAVACKKEDNNQPTSNMKVDFEMSATSVYAGTEVTFTAKVTDGTAPYTYAWKVGDEATFDTESFTWTPENNGSYLIKLTVEDATGAKVERGKRLVVEAAPIVPTGEVKLIWTAKLTGYTAMTSPAVADDGSIYTVTRDNNTMYKISKDGTIVWEKPVLNNPQDGSQILGTPSIDTDGTIYICGGSKNGDATLVAFNASGNEKWRFGNENFWNQGNTPAASINGVTAGIGDKNVYIGNTGSAGTVMAISKADGKRVNFIMSADGKGPSGGVRSGVLISNDGYLGWSGGAYGIFGVNRSTIDAEGEGTPWGWHSFYSKASGWPDGNNQGPLAALKVDGKNALVGLQSIKADGDVAAHSKVFAVDFATGEELAAVKIDECAKQDQGGVVITNDGLVVAALKYSLGTDDGGIAIVDMNKKEMVGHYRIGENVAASPAIDNNGYIHFGTESGNYYVVKFDGAKFETLVKKDIAELIANDERYKEAYANLLAEEDGVRINWAKIWSGIVIADDGTIYIQFTDNENRSIGGLAAVTVDYTTGPSTASPWPMMGQNRKHTYRQK